LKINYIPLIFRLNQIIKMKHFKFILPLILILFSCSNDSVQTTENTKLELTVKDENNIPVDNVQVKLYASQADCNSDSNILQTLTTDVNGKVTFENLQSITYYWNTVNACYDYSAGNTISPITSNTLNQLSTNITSSFTGGISIQNNNVYDYSVTYTGPQNGTITVNTNDYNILYYLPIGNYLLEMTPINSPTPTTSQVNLTVNCGLETGFIIN